MSLECLPIRYKYPIYANPYQILGGTIVHDPIRLNLARLIQIHRQNNASKPVPLASHISTECVFQVSLKLTDVVQCSNKS